MRAVLASMLCVVLVACAGKVDYIRPSASPQPGANVKLVETPRDVVWNATVPELGKRFFVINNLDKASGLINVSYSGDPEKYIDCGRIISYVKNVRGERTYDFSGSKAQQSYEIMDANGLYFIDRRMALEGRVNLIFEEVSPTSTRVTANTRYVVQRQRTITTAMNNASRTLNDSVTFNTGGRAPFAGTADTAAECAATGALEREILDAVQ